MASLAAATSLDAGGACDGLNTPSDLQKQQLIAVRDAAIVPFRGRKPATEQVIVSGLTGSMTNAGIYDDVIKHVRDRVRPRPRHCPCHRLVRPVNQGVNHA